MKTSTIQKIAAFKIGQLVPALTPIIFVLMFFSLRWAAVLGAFLFTAMFCLSPAHYRTRSGSLIPAICLAAFLWLCAAMVFAFSFSGAR